MKLQNKIPLYVITVLLIVGLIGSVAIIIVQRRSSEHQFEETARAMSASILSGLEQDMINEDRSHVQYTLDDLSQNDSIGQIDIISPDGRIWASTSPAAIDTASSSESRALLAGSSLGGDITMYGDEHLTLLTPIPAKEVCLDCHGSIAAAPNAQNYLGAIRVDVTTTFLDRNIANSQRILLVVGGLTFILVSGTIVLMLRRSVLRPLSRLTAVSSRISDGDYTERVTVETPGNEIGAVSVAFNEMLDEVESNTQRLESANRELEQASRMKSEFLANMSHELRTPLNVIIGFSEVLKDTPVDQLGENDRREFCENIVSSGYHLLELINDVLDLAKVEAGQMQFLMEEFYISPALNEVIATMQPLAAKKQLTLGVQVSEQLSSVYADVGKFKQILYNIVGNAIKFTPEGGSVNVSASLADDVARFAITDTGVGIAEDDQKRIFSEFQQVDGSASRHYEGTGLGLALTRKFVEMQNGRIWVESSVGAGSTFFFTLPLPGKAELLPATTAGRDVAAIKIDDGSLSADGYLSASTETKLDSTDSPRILVVEDDESTAKLIGVWLTREGYSVDFAKDGVEALEKVKAAPPFAVCLDIMLPRKDGWQVLQDLKTDPETADVGVILCSALDKPELGFALGAADYCVKPLSRRHLLDKLRQFQKSAPSKRSQPQILVADSDSETCVNTGATLERQGFGVEITHDGEKTLERALQLCPDVIILDMMLPVVNCFDVVSSLRRHPVTADTPIIVTTSKNLTTVEKKFLEQNVQTIIQKKSGKEQLLEEIFRLEKLDPERARLIDDETRLFNRRYFDKRLAEEIKRSERYALDMSVLLIRIDNSNMQPLTRSTIITEIAVLLRSTVRSADPLARFDASSFAVLLPETHGRAGATVAGKILDLIHDIVAMDEDGNEVSVTACAAVSESPCGLVPADALVPKLTSALDALEKKGGNAVELVN